MLRDKTSELKSEKERLGYTVNYMKDIINATEEYKKNFKENIKDAYVHLDYLDSSQSYISIMVNSNFLENAMKNHDNYKKAIKKPYFARIDIQSKKKQSPEIFYIGKISLFKDEDNSPLVIDWRSPLASVYYDGRLGEVSYESPSGEQIVDLKLKRQFTIQDGELEDYMDIDMTANDNFLQAVLEENADDKLKDIASTIQAEQNKVIRAELKKPLIVQGVAGSGKTTIALHRIAYFIYTYEDILDPENFMIIAPNKLFINYISEVLPELGVEDVKQTTYIELMKDFIGFSFKVENPFENMELLIQKDTTKDVDLLKWLLSFKGSLDIKEMMDQYVEDLELDFVPKADFALQEHIIMKHTDLNKMFLEDLKGTPLFKRVDQIKQNLRHKFNGVKKTILKETEEQYDFKIQSIRDTEAETEERRQKILSLIEARDKKLESLKKDSRTLVNHYIKQFPKTKLLEYYKDLFGDADCLRKYMRADMSDNQVKYFSEYVKKAIAKKSFDLEDLTALSYLQYKIFGFDKKFDIKNVVIDEAQDYSPLQIYTLKKIFNTNMFTLLGDLSQGIYSYRGINDWKEITENVFENKADYMSLVQSYRTTIEIMNQANHIIGKLDHTLDLAKPVIRHGKEPLIMELDNKQKVLDSIYKEILETKKAYSSIAIIGKTVEECKIIQKELKNRGLQDIHILEEDQDNYGAGITIVPSYLAKGLEFDVVIVATLNENYSMNELDLKLLYVALTRALHRLYILGITGSIKAIH
ncbi:DNA helicase-2/ATP-dependent DNA helicase PcrA [Natranaerovirga hydrolytica]|uniref:DNA helicase-2/ATP-dependent DNA helicase PcrA n=1 Tax=Natranaerovirga hydrolytica TaxID=680378 RepID=A0A4R1MY30_9FIRM|nr:RNA polymerase recycling motor HelD [Natranaerovirga hydrolytica]TCK98188.1 DNA helicase-2/ATP-dependent DNA helicase PcrA [Natranaerovirga hydrolytica]